MITSLRVLIKDLNVNEKMNTKESIDKFIRSIETNIKEQQYNINESTKILSYIKDYIERPTLISYVENGDILEIMMLVDEGFDVNETNENGESLLMLAINGIKTSRKFIDICLFLVNNGADINVVSKSGDTALTRAIDIECSGNGINPDICELLLDNGVSTDHIGPLATAYLKIGVKYYKNTKDIDIKKLKLKFIKNIQM